MIIEKILELRKLKYSCSKISDKVNQILSISLSEDLVYAIIKSRMSNYLNYSPEPNKSKHYPQIDEIKIYRKNGYKLKEIVSKLGITYSTLYNLMAKHIPKFLELTPYQFRILKLFSEINVISVSEVHTLMQNKTRNSIRAVISRLFNNGYLDRKKIFIKKLNKEVFLYSLSKQAKDILI